MSKLEHMPSPPLHGSNNRLLFSAIRVALYTTLLGSSAAHAQDKVGLEELVVTGTRIRGVDAPVGSNVIAIGAEDIPRTGLATTSDLLRSVPQVANLGLDESRTNGAQRAISNLSSGTSINLRGLGVEATLTLVDGRRPVPSGGEGRVFDPNSIPTIALQRIEVVADGSSAIYGSDAMTGVVNLITRRDYDGAETRVSYGSADGYDQIQAQQIAGLRFARGGFMLAGEYFQRDNLSTADRPTLYNDASVNSTLAFLPNVSTTSTAANRFVDANGNGAFDVGDANGTPRTQSNWLGVDVLPEQKRKSLFVAGDVDIGDRFKVYGEGYYTKRDFTRLATAVTMNGTTVPATNPYNLSGAPIRVFYSFINDFGPQQLVGFEEVWQGTLGGTLRFGNDWEADLSTSYGQVEDWRRRATVNTNAITAALANTSTATALDPFSNGVSGYPSQQVRQTVLAAIASYDITNPKMNIWDTQLKVDGPLFSLPGGDVRLAAGIERQDLERTQVITSTAAPAPNVNSPIATVAPELNRTVNSIFSEVFVPVVGANNAMPGLRSLSLALALRYDRYDDTQVAPALKLLDKSTTNPKFGVTWKPIDDLTVRGTYGKSFRAPVLGDYSYGAPTVNAPVTVSSSVASAYGLPPGSPTYMGSMIQGGHTLGLTPEKATTWSLGAEFKPSSIDGLSVSLNYYNIVFKNQISVPADSNSLQNLSYAQALAGSGNSLVLPGVGLVVFRPTTAQLQAYLAHGGSATAHIGPPDATLYGAASAPVGAQNTPVYVLIESLSHNGGILKTEGIDFTAQYAWDTSIGSWVVDDTLTYVLSYKQALLPGVALVGYLNQLNFPLKFQTRAHTGWRLGHWNADLYVNYQNAYQNTAVTPAVEIASNTTFDARVAFDTGDTGDWLGNFTIALSALNVLDKEPPYARVTQGAAVQNFDSQNASPVGRFLSLQIAKQW